MNMIPREKIKANNITNSFRYKFIQVEFINNGILLTFKTISIDDKWHHECHATVDRFYEEKCQELQERCVEKVGEKRKKIHQLKLKTNELIREQEATHDDICSLKATINDIKREINQFEENGIVVDADPLIMNKNLVYIEQWTSNELDLSTLSSPFRTVAYSKDSWTATISNNHFLLIDQCPNLCLYDKQSILLKEYPWEYDSIPDMCWSSTLNSFIIITGKNGIFLMNENLTSLECIQTIEKKRWLSCTCSDSTLFLTTNESDSNIFQFNLLLSFHFMKEWKSPQSCNSDEEQTHIVSTTNITRFGSWNVRSCYRVTKRELIVRRLKRYQIEVAALAETNIPNSGIYVVNEYTFIYSGALEKERTRAAHGAAVCLGPKASRVWRNSGSIWRSVNSRIVAVRIKCQSIPITVIAVYAPVNPSNGLNARVGVEQASSAQSVVGKHAVDKQNQNGRRLVDFCLFNRFVITNTFFPHKSVHQTTWMHPKTKQWYMLDYILVNRRFRNSIQDVSAHRGATGGIGTDHHLLMVKVRIHLKCRKKTTETGRLKLDYEKLNNEKLVAEFQTELLKHRNNTQENNRDLSVNEKFTQFADYIHEHSKEYFIKDQKYQKNTKEWFTHEIADIVDKKAKAYLQWQHHRGKIDENKYRNQYRMLAKTVKNKLEARQREY
ncbi:unnamed protein product [Rotaria magnacalcarata]|uniref:Endonuclease/exonuclease/phosphatase domain-containing protein n=1 Tax=Rotaria magnacalcarata TaxID=392030 RepID=A0A816P797_9BILA|nr:unnamed protein product [Rotaria magnacalcarata]